MAQSQLPEQAKKMWRPFGGKWFVAVALAMCAVVGLTQEQSERYFEIDMDNTPRDFDSREFTRLAVAADLGSAEAQYSLGVLYSVGFLVSEKRDAEAMALWRKSAVQGFAPAQRALGEAYAFGNGVDADYDEAARWCRLAAEQRDRRGQLCFGLMYGIGVGVEQDYAESLRLLRLAAEQGEGAAQARLGDMYATGEGGVERDPHEAHRWYRLATQRYREVTGVIAGVEFTSGRELLWHLFRLGELYRIGMSVSHNRIASYKWFDVGNRLGWSSATLKLIRIGDRMTAKELAEAQGAADSLFLAYLEDTPSLSLAPTDGLAAWAESCHMKVLPWDARGLTVYGPFDSYEEAVECTQPSLPNGGRVVPLAYDTGAGPLGSR